MDINDKIFVEFSNYIFKNKLNSMNEKEKCHLAFDIINSINSVDTKILNMLKRISRECDIKINKNETIVIDHLNNFIETNFKVEVIHKSKKEKNESPIIFSDSESNFIMNFFDDDEKTNLFSKLLINDIITINDHIRLNKTYNLFNEFILIKNKDNFNKLIKVYNNSKIITNEYDRDNMCHKLSDSIIDNFNITTLKYIIKYILSMSINNFNIPIPNALDLLVIEECINYINDNNKYFR